MDAQAPRYLLPHAFIHFSRSCDGCLRHSRHALLTAFERVAGMGNVSEAYCQGDKGIESSQFNVEMMLVCGYAGVGKSALVQELYKPIIAKLGYFVSGKFDQFGSNIPYSAIANALQKLVQQLLGEPDEQLQKWRSRN